MIQKPSKQNKTKKSLGYISCNICDKKPVAVVQSLSHVQLFETPWTVAHQASLTFTISQSLLKLLSIELVTPFNHLILCRPLLLPSIFPSIRDQPGVSCIVRRILYHWATREACLREFLKNFLKASCLSGYQRNSKFYCPKCVQASTF